MSNPLASSWYLHLEDNMVLATTVMILTGMAFAVSLSVRSLLLQLVCKAMDALDIEIPENTCSTAELIAHAFECLFVILLVLFVGWLLVKGIKVRVTKQFSASNVL